LLTVVAGIGVSAQPLLLDMDVGQRQRWSCNYFLDLLGKFREHDELKDTPIIVVTARAERDDIVAALAYGATGYLNKPIKAEALLRHVKDALGIP
jgi:CheY-like chemotaxis protein